MLGYLVRVFYDYSSPTRASLGLGTYALRPQRDIAHGERASCKTLGISKIDLRTLVLRSSLLVVSRASRQRSLSIAATA